MAAAAQGIEEIDRGLRQEQNRGELARWEAMILADAGFRRATVTKRTTVAKILLAAQGEVIEDQWLESRLLKEVRQAAAIEVSQHEQNLESQIPDIAERLIGSDLWVDVRTKGKQRTAVAQFIGQVTDGWMLSEPFLEQVRDAALVAAARHRLRR